MVVLNTEALKAVFADAGAGHDPFDLIEAGCGMIRTKDSRLIALTPATMRPGQRRFYELVKADYRAGRMIKYRILKYRQGGFSSVCELIVFFVTLCRRYYNALVISNLEGTATWLHSMDKLFQEQMEQRGSAWLELRKSNTREIVWLGSASSIRIGSEQSKNLGITETRNAVHCTEVAYYEHWDTLWGNLRPSISDQPGNMILIESTANGVGNAFHRDWLAGERGEGELRNLFFPWFEDPDYQAEPPSGWQPDSYVAGIRATYKLTRAQGFWYEQMLGTFRGNKALMAEKYPCNAVEAFQTSGSIVYQTITPSLNRILTVAPKGKYVDLYRPTPKTVMGRTVDQSVIEVFSDPKRGEEYVLYSDTGEGLKGLDDEAVMVEGESVSVTASTGIVRARLDWCLCAILECRYPIDVFADLSELLAFWYNTALWGIEIPGPGQGVIGRVQGRYPNLYRHEWRDAENELRQKSEWGYRNDSISKPRMEADWEAFVRDRPEAKTADGIVMHSGRVAAQALTYIQDPRTGKHRPRSGCFSDLLLADMGAVQLLKARPAGDKKFDQAKQRYYETMAKRGHRVPVDPETGGYR